MALNTVSYLSPKVTAGLYKSADITVNSQGRIVTIATGGDVSIPTGTTASFVQASAPLGWTQNTIYNDLAVRVVSGAGGGTGGTVPFSTFFSSSPTYSGPVNVTGTQVNDTTLSEGQLPNHNHIWGIVDSVGGRSGGNVDAEGTTPPSGVNGQMSYVGGSPHTHSLSGVTATGSFAGGFNVAYVDIIIASKNNP